MGPDIELEHQTTAERLAALELLTAKLLKIQLQAREPIDKTVYVSATKPWIFDYRNRKHVFLWLPSALTLSFEDYGSGVVNGQQWLNLAMPTGIRVLAPGQSSPAPMMLRFTDEVVP